MKISLKQVEEVLTSMKKGTAEEIASQLGLKLTQENRKEVLSRVRRLARAAVIHIGGTKEEYNEDKQLIYSIE